MDPGLLFIGVMIGLAVAAPLGPVNIMVIRSTLRRGLAGGLAAGAGSVLADTIYAVIAAYGLRQIAHLLFDHERLLNSLGGALLVVIGVRIARTHLAEGELAAAAEPTNSAHLWRNAATTFTTTLTNPGALFGVFAIFGTMSGALRLGEQPLRPAVATAGFALGGMLWWLFLSFLVDRLKSRLTVRALDRVNRWTGVLIAAFGFALLMRAFD